MAFTYLHYAEVYDVGRGARYILYRFPFQTQVVERLKNSIPKHARYWTSETKAWHVQEDWAEVAENILEEAFPDLPFCPSCKKKGMRCKAWSHVNPDKQRRAWREEPRTAEQEFYRETAEQRSNAQEAYNEWAYKRWGERRAQGHAWTPPPPENEEPKQQRTHYRSRQGYDSFRDAWRGFHARARQTHEQSQKEKQQETPPQQERWVDPGPRRRDSRWAMRILGITSIPTKRELKKLFRKLAVKYHPDHGGDSEKMALINAANEYLQAYIG